MRFCQHLQAGEEAGRFTGEYFSGCPEVIPAQNPNWITCPFPARIFSIRWNGNGKDLFVLARLQPLLTNTECVGLEMVPNNVVYNVKRC
jgi:hypothetical protein